LSHSEFQPLFQADHDLADGFLERDRNVQTGVMAAYFEEVGDVVDVVAGAVFVEILEDLA
jgi:hypothetical protein